MNAQNNADCTLIDRFSLMERIVMRTGWYGFMAIAAFGIYKHSAYWAAFYVVFSLLGFALVVLPKLCAHCPYPSKHNTCLFLPPAFVRRFYPYKGPKMRPVGKIMTIIVGSAMVIFPQFWLISDLPILVLFWLFCLPMLIVIPAYYCSRCRNFDCPLNKVPSSIRSSEIR